MELLIFFILLAVGVSFVCSILEAVLLSVHVSYISVLEKERPKAGKLLKDLKKNINHSIPAILILNTLAHTLGASGVGMQAEKLYNDEGVFLISFILTLLILFASEIIPKTLGALYYKQLAVISAYTIKGCIYLTYPLLIFSEFITNRIYKNHKTDSSITKEEIIETTLIGEDSGAIGSKESNFIESILKLDQYKIKDILTPRTVVFAINEDSTIEEILKINNIYRFSRIPVYKDNIDNVTGLVLAKKLFSAAYNLKKSTKLKEIAKNIFKINKNIPVQKALNLFINKKEHLFLVTDNFGQTEGIVTLEDCIETLLGMEIVDEFDTIDDMQKLALLKMKEKRKLNNNDFNL